MSVTPEKTIRVGESHYNRLWEENAQLKREIVWLREELAAARKNRDHWMKQTEEAEARLRALRKEETP